MPIFFILLFAWKPSYAACRRTNIHFSASAASKTGYSQASLTPYTQTQQTRQVTAIKPAAPSTFSIYPVSSTVQPVAAASVVPSYSQSPTYSTNAVTYSGKHDMQAVTSMHYLPTTYSTNAVTYSQSPTYSTNPVAYSGKHSNTTRL